MVPHFIIVDDDFINNILCQKIINWIFPTADVQTFLEPEKALIYINSAYTQPNAPLAVLLLDINMPTLTGWEFLETFEQFDAAVKENIKIYMLSSSSDNYDKERAAANKNVSGYFEKPLTRNSVESVLNKVWGL